MLRRLATGATSLFHEQKIAFHQSLYCRGLKGSTGIVGIEVDPEARQTFTEKCKAVIDLVGQHIPQEAAYRRTVENTYRHRLKTSESEMADEEVEETFSAQLEQLTKMADEELALIPLMAEWKPWDVPEGHKVRRHYFSATNPWQVAQTCYEAQGHKCLCDLGQQPPAASSGFLQPIVKFQGQSF
ncbi:hypothetical protein WJX74_010267 [Apatococcus lobatus]|uniref:NADH dehydrogenase [ubiquinone] 1 alpha subcomplex subunit 5 n=1 Tax=Apatococcus lobatus TaxID=904363 RepID=A0AAW1RJN3_9CHLO